MSGCNGNITHSITRARSAYTTGMKNETPHTRREKEKVANPESVSVSSATAKLAQG